MEPLGVGLANNPAPLFAMFFLHLNVYAMRMQHCDALQDDPTTIAGNTCWPCNYVLRRWYKGWKLAAMQAEMNKNKAVENKFLAFAQAVISAIKRGEARSFLNVMCFPM